MRPLTGDFMSFKESHSHFRQKEVLVALSWAYQSVHSNHFKLIFGLCFFLVLSGAVA